MMPFITILFALGCFLGLWAGLALIISTDWERISRALIDLLRSWKTDGLYRRRVAHYRKLVLGDDVTLRESDLYLDRRFADRVEWWKRCARERDEFLAELCRLKRERR